MQNHQGGKILIESFVLLYFGHYIIFRTRSIIWTFWVQMCSDYHSNSIYIYYSYIWLVGFCYAIMYTILSVYCTWYTEDMFKLMCHGLKKSLSIL